MPPSNFHQFRDTTAATMNRGLALLFASAAGIAVGSLYLAQPLIETIASQFGVTPATAATLVTVTQIGYAIGVFLIVPLGDVLDRRKLVPGVLVLSAASLLGAAFAPAYGILLVALGALGLTSVAAQILIPLASELARPEMRGRIVGTVAAGGLIGILLSRTISGLIADIWGWRAVYLVDAAIAFGLAILLAVRIPKLPARQSVPYFRLLGSVFTSVARHPAALVTLLITGANFAVFSMFWTALTFLLSAAPFSYTTTQIGLMGLAGLAGAIASRRAGVMHDMGWSVPATGGALGLLAISLLCAWASAESIIGLVISVIVLDIAVMVNLILGQTRLFALSDTERSRLNTAVVVFNFIGGALGSFLAGPLWSAGGWTGIMVGALAMNGLALLIWATSRARLVDPT